MYQEKIEPTNTEANSLQNLLSRPVSAPTEQLAPVSAPAPVSASVKQLASEIKPTETELRTIATITIKSRSYCEFYFKNFVRIVAMIYIVIYIMFCYNCSKLSEKKQKEKYTTIVLTYIFSAIGILLSIILIGIIYNCNSQNNGWMDLICISNIICLIITSTTYLISET